LAEQFDANIIGVAAANAEPAHYAGGAFAQSLVKQLQSEIKKKMAETEQLFRSTMQQRAPTIEWNGAARWRVHWIT
jgi:hypothetical protein